MTPVVLDANVTVSGLLYGGVAQQVVEAVRTGTCTAYASPIMLQELGPNGVGHGQIRLVSGVSACNGRGCLGNQEHDASPVGHQPGRRGAEYGQRRMFGILHWYW